MKKEESYVEIDLLEVGAFLLKRWWQLLIGIIIGAIAGGLISFFQPDKFTSQSMLYVLSKTTSITSVADLQLGNALSNDFVVIATSKPVLDTAIEKVKNDSGYVINRNMAKKMTTVKNETNTRLLTISVTSEYPELSRSLANAIAEATSEQMAAIMKSDPPTTVERAELAAGPNSKNLTRNAVIGAIIGFLLIAIINIIIMLANDRIKTPDDVEKYLEVPVLAAIPLDRSQAAASVKAETAEKKKAKKKTAKK